MFRMFVYYVVHILRITLAWLHQHLHNQHHDGSQSNKLFSLLFHCLSNLSLLCINTSSIYLFILMWIYSKYPSLYLYTMHISVRLYIWFLTVYPFSLIYMYYVYDIHIYSWIHTYPIYILYILGAGFLWLGDSGSKSWKKSAPAPNFILILLFL